MCWARVLVDESVIERLEKGEDGIDILWRDEFGDGLWLLGVASHLIPLETGLGEAPMRELVICDAYGPVPAYFKPWAEL